MSQPLPKKPFWPNNNVYAKYSGMAFQMMAIIGLGSFAGIKLDAWLALEFPAFTLVFVFLSVGLSLYSVIKNLS